MKKSEGIALQNRIDYLQLKLERKEKEIKRLNKAVDELQQASEILLKTVALRYGGEDGEIIVDRRMDLAKYDAQVNLEDDRMIIKLKEAK